MAECMGQSCLSLVSLVLQGSDVSTTEQQFVFPFQRYPHMPGFRGVSGTKYRHLAPEPEDLSKCSSGKLKSGRSRNQYLSITHFENSKKH